MDRHNISIGGNAAFHNFHRDYSHIRDASLRRRLILSEIDKVPFGWFHLRAIGVTGIGFFLDSYDIFSINLLMQMLGLAFWNRDSSETGNSSGTVSNGGLMPIDEQIAIKAATAGGAVLGQLLFGFLADKLGRRRMYGVELVIIVLATFAQSLASPSPAISMSGLLIFWRVVMGFGIGGDYPLSSVITSEFAPTRWRGAMMAAVFSTQGAGQFVAALVSLITTIGFKESLSAAASTSDCVGGCQIAADKAWRIICGVGCIPAVFALYYRITIPETPRYTFDVGHDIEKGSADAAAYMAGESGGYPDLVAQATQKSAGPPSISSIPHASLGEFLHYFGQWKNGKALLGTTLSWFFLDFAYYGLGLNNGTIIQAIGYSGGDTVYETLYKTAVGNIILVCAGAIPGYWLSIAFLDRIGRKPIQIGGFVILTMIFLIIGFGFFHLSQGAFLALYVLAQLFFNFGPNTTTFIVPGECFPTRYRATAHGISAAAGKIGSIVALIVSHPLLEMGAKQEGSCKRKNGTRNCNPWLSHLMVIFGFVMFLGILVSLLIPETKGMTLEELSGEAGGAASARLPPPRRKARRGRWLLGTSCGSDESRSTRHEHSITHDGACMYGGPKTMPSTGPWAMGKYNGWTLENIPMNDIGKLIR